jgi:GAF domain-containing protein
MTEDAARRDDSPLHHFAPITGEASSSALAFSVLHEVLSALAHDQPLDLVVSLLAEKAQLLTGSASAAIALLEPDGDTVSFVAVAGQEAQEVQGSRVHITDTVMGNTARTGEPFLAFRPAPGAPVSPDEGKSPTFAPPSSAAVVPIFDQGKPVGSLAALGKVGNVPFSGEDLLCLSTLAAAAAVVLANSRLRTDTNRQSRELSVLYEAVRNVSGQLSAQEVLRTVVEQVREHLDTAAVVVFLANDERTHLYIAEDEGLESEDREVTLTAASGVGRLLLESAQPSFLQFLDLDTDFPAAPTRTGTRGSQTLTSEPLFPFLNVRSGIAAPIASSGEVQGIVLALSGQPLGVYTSTEANLLGALAAQAAVAMENAWLYEDATRRAEEATALYEISQTVTSTLRLSDVLERVADAVLNLLSVDKFALFLQETKSETLRLVVTRNLAAGAEERIRPQIGQGIPGWVLEFETPTAVQDVAADHRNASAPLHTEGVVSMTCMPLQIGVGTIGVLCAMSTRRRLFTVAEMELLYTIANQAAIAIENARIYADVRQKSLELRRYFHRVARALGSAQTPDEVPKIIASLTMEVMGADRCALYAVRNSADEQPALLCAASEGFRIVVDPYAAPRPLGDDAPTGWVARRDKPLAIEDLNEDPRFSEHYDRPLRGRAVSYLGVPLRRGDRVIGVLEVYTRGRRQWRGDEIRLMLTFASQATVAFQNARLARKQSDAERQARLLETLLQYALAVEPIPLDTLIHELQEGLGEPLLLCQSHADGWRLLHSLPPEITETERDALLQSLQNTRAETLPGYHLETDEAQRFALLVKRDDAQRPFPSALPGYLFALLSREQSGDDETFH